MTRVNIEVLLKLQRSQSEDEDLDNLIVDLDRVIKDFLTGCSCLEKHKVRTVVEEDEQ